MPKKIYAVRKGRQTGLFTTWAECQKQVTGYAGARFKGFTNAEEAMRCCPEMTPPVPIRHSLPVVARFMQSKDPGCPRNRQPIQTRIISFIPTVRA